MFEDLQSHLDALMQAQNFVTIPEFEDYTPEAMHQVLHHTFSAQSPITINRLSSNEYKEIPILNAVKWLTTKIDEAGELKLTKKGFLPVNLATALYHQSFMQDRYAAYGQKKIYRETDSIRIFLPRAVLEITGIIKKRSNKLSITKNAKVLLADSHSLVNLMLRCFAQKFKWSSVDGYEMDLIGRIGFGFSIILLQKYGSEKRDDSFYSNKYFLAYPRLLDFIYPKFGTVQAYATSCYVYRTFEVIMLHFGLVTIESEHRMPRTRLLTKTQLLDQLFTIEPAI